MEQHNDGFNAFGKPVPQFRRQAAYDTCRQIGVEDAEICWSLANGMAEQIERDKPHAAMELGCKHLDLTGTYRVMAVLCTAQKAAA
jgi:hypothetical protein